MKNILLNRLPLFTSLLSLVLFVSGCSSTKKTSDTELANAGRPTNSMEASEKVAALLRNVYFDYDQYVLNEDDATILQEVADYLKQYPDLKITIEGHTDERGSIEYNLALGEKRARTVVQFLVDLGIEPQQLSMISYGEEKPIALGQTESSYKQNRRAQFVVDRVTSVQ